MHLHLADVAQGFDVAVGAQHAVGADLAGFAAGVIEIPAVTTDLPPVATGYAYRTFRITAPVSAGPGGFLQVLAAEDTP